MSRRNPPTTPIARSKSAALSRVLDLVGRGYTQYTTGNVKAEKAEALANKFHRLYEIGASPARRITRRKAGMANAALVMYWPEGAVRMEWLLLVAGAELEGEQLRDVTDRHRLVFLGYEMVRYPKHGRTAWTWRRPKEDMAEIHTMLAEYANRRAWSAVDELLQRVASQPGFHGVREQSWRIGQAAIARGYPGKLPTLYYMRKLSHGEPLHLGV